MSDETARREIVKYHIGTSRLVFVQAIVISINCVLDVQRNTVTFLRRNLLLTERKTSRLRVRIASVDHTIEEGRIGQIAYSQRVVFEHIALTVWRLVLGIELTLG